MWICLTVSKQIQSLFVAAYHWTAAEVYSILLAKLNVSAMVLGLEPRVFEILHIYILRMLSF